MFETETLRVTVDGPIAVISFIRPEMFNRFDAEQHDEFPEAVAYIARLAKAEDIRAAVLASTGDVFSAGGDFDLITKAHHDMRFLIEHADAGKACLLGLTSLPMPTIAAVQGPAIGLGATLALACDLVVAAKAAKFADPHVNVGLVAGDGGCLVWPMAIGMKRAARYLLTGDRLPAEKAYEFGLVTDLVEEPSEALPAAMALAQKIAALPPLAVQGTKRTLANIVSARAAEIVDLALTLETRSTLSEDLLEAIAAFKEHRPGKYVGR